MRLATSPGMTHLDSRYQSPERSYLRLVTGTKRTVLFGIDGCSSAGRRSRADQRRLRRVPRASVAMNGRPGADWRVIAGGIGGALTRPLQKQHPPVQEEHPPACA